MIKTENKLLPLIQALKIKTLSEELQDYKVNSVKGLQDLYLFGREGLQDCKRGRIKILDLENWDLKIVTCLLSSESFYL